MARMPLYAPLGAPDFVSAGPTVNREEDLAMSTASPRRIAWLIGCTALALLWMSPASAQQQTCFPSKFGPTDEIGAANNLTPAKTLAASKLVTKGKAYRLGIETNKNTPAYPPRTWAVTIVQPGQTMGTTIGPNKATYNDDIITGWVGIGSQIDGLGHLGIDNVYYNCNKAPDFVKVDGLTKLGIETVPAIATR